MASPRCTLVEVAEDLACAGGDPLAPILDLEELLESREIMGEDRLEARLPRTSAAWAHLRERRVIPVRFSDGSFDEWRLNGFNEARRDGGLPADFTAVAPDLDLADLTPIARTEADGSVVYDFEAPSLTIAQHLSSYILPALNAAGATWFAAGQLDSTAPVDLVYSWTTPKAACLQLAQGLGLEFRLRRNGTTGYYLDFLTAIAGATDPLGQAAKLYVLHGRNLLAVSRKRSATEQATRVYGRGTPEEGLYPTIAEALWKVASAPTTTTLRLVDPNGGDGPILEDNQLNDLYVRKWPTGTWVQVTDSTLANHEVLTGAVHGCVANDLVQFSTSSTGGALTCLTSPSAEAIYGFPGGTRGPHKILDRPDLPGTVNLVSNPAMRAYAAASNGPADDWAIIPGCGLPATSVDKETTAGRWRSGGQSTKVVTTADGQGIETKYAAITPTDARPFFSGFIGYWLDTDGGKVRVDMVAGKATVSISSMSRATAGGITTVTVNTGAAHGLALGEEFEVLGVTGGTTADGYNGVRKVSRVVDTDTVEYQLTSDPGTVSLSSATIRPVVRFVATASPGSKFWNDLGWQNEDLKKRGATVVKMRVMQDGATGLTMYADRAQVTQGTGEGQRAFIEGSGPTQLWQAVNRKLAELAAPAVSIDVTVADLARLLPATYTADDIRLGGTIEIHDPEWLAPVTTRILAVRRNLLVEAETQLTLSNRPGDLIDEQVRPVRGTRLIPHPPNGRRKRYTIPISGTDFKPVTSTDAARLNVNFSAGVQCIVNVTFSTTGVCSVGIARDLLTVGARIVGFRVYSDQTNPGSPGSAIFRLYRADSVVAEVAVIDAAGRCLNTVDEVITQEGYSLWASLTDSGSSQVFLLRMELELEVDEVPG